MLQAYQLTLEQFVHFDFLVNVAATVRTDRGDGSLPAAAPGPRCPRCPGGATPDRPPTLMGGTGTGIVEVQRWRCDRDSSHWWDEFRPIVDPPSDELGGRRSPALLPHGSTNLPRARQGG